MVCMNESGYIYASTGNNLNFLVCTLANLEQSGSWTFGKFIQNLHCDSLVLSLFLLYFLGGVFARLNAFKLKARTTGLTTSSPPARLLDILDILYSVFKCL
ncbi:unnamed protein product [Ceratitis capitata]|uniref:(Mediterranean fruit fly) hypothetical protein n=1 Tax=Ceratitis capitata TaxID=7213 RepID=A0A811UES6_CERCA|nr:unnamed protein product [Ceratitis capitata]